MNLQRFAPFAIKDTGVSQVFDTWGLRYDVEISTGQIGPYPEFPWIKPSKMLQSMANTNDLKKLLGGLSWQDAQPALGEFWNRYKQICPEHGVFRRVRESLQTTNPLKLTQMIPIMVHGDEGTTYKKHGMLVLQFSGLFGRGSRNKPAEASWHQQLQTAGIPLNLLGQTVQTRFLTFLCPRDRKRKIMLNHCLLCCCVLYVLRISSN